MRAAVIENGVVVNIIVVADWYKGHAIPTGDLPVAIGDTYDGVDFWRDGAKVAVPVPGLDQDLEQVIDILTGEGEGE